jgi:sulfopyruvate decarboxylase subunit beta
LLKTILRDPEFKVVQVCKEDEGISICSGLFSAGQRSLMMMQYTGLLDSVNSLRGVAVEGENPVCMLVGLLGKEPGVAPSDSKKYGVKIIEPVLDAMGIAHHWVEESADTQKIVPAVEKAYASTRPMALLVGREPR